MRPIYTLSLSTFLACGPLAPPLETTTANSPDTSTTTEAPPSPSSSSTDTPTTTTLDSTTLDLSTTASTTDEMPFIIKPDGGDGGTVECDLFAQDCDRGQKCVAWAADGSSAWNATKCVEVTGDRAPGEPCTSPGGGITGIDDCTFGAYCWYVDENDHGICVALCTGTPDAPKCLPGFVCPLYSESVLNFCFPTCDPLLPDCPGTDLCIPAVDDFYCTPDASGDDGQLNDPCEFANACDKGLLCLNTATASAACQQGSQGCCQPFCKFPDSPCPNPDQQCLQWFAPMQPIPPGSEDIGVCAIPE